ncbi:MAG TPA: DUF1573 domain-containing protein [Bacteroidales bacterium]
MKKFIIIYLSFIAIVVSNCGNVSKKNPANAGLQLSDTGTAKIYFNEYQHDFGKVAEGEKVGYNFTFQNKGTTSLVIISATTTCGCTVPKYDTKPIVPDGNGNLEVVFDTSGRSGIQTKIITVKSNASIPEVLLKITAEVVPAK